MNFRLKIHEYSECIIFTSAKKWLYLDKIPDLNFRLHIKTKACQNLTTDQNQVLKNLIKVNEINKLFSLLNAQPERQILSWLLFPIFMNSWFKRWIYFPITYARKKCHFTKKTSGWTTRVGRKFMNTVQSRFSDTFGLCKNCH